MSPLELRREFEAERLRRLDQQRRDLALAWYTAMLSRMEKPPKLDALLPHDPTERRPVQTRAEQRSAMQILSAQYGIPLRTRH